MFLVGRMLSVVGLLWLASCQIYQVDAYPQGSIYSGSSGVPNALPTDLLPATTAFTSGVPPMQSTSTSAEPNTVGSVHSSLETSGRPSVAPFNTSPIPLPTASIQVSSVGTLAPSSKTPTTSTYGNIFSAIATGAPPSQIPLRADHPVKGIGIGPQNGPLHTNKFYANFFLGNQTNAVWTHPYSVTWAKGSGKAGSWGLSVSHIERSSLVYGPPNYGDPPQYFLNPIGVQSIILSAVELSNATLLTTDTHQAFSVNANLAPYAGVAPLVSFPLVQGMGFVTAIYTGGTVLLQSGVYFQTLAFCGSINNNMVFKYRIVLEDDTTWLLYVTPNGATGPPPFILLDSMTIKGPVAFQGIVQVAKNPAGLDGEVSYDSAAGTYPISGAVTAGVENNSGSYKLSWKRAGIPNQNLLMFALPHHVETMVTSSKVCETSIQLVTTTKGNATAFLANSFKMVEPNLPVDIGFAPWSPQKGSATSVSLEAIQAINAAATVELGQNITNVTNLDSMYFSGKALSKYATIIYTVNQFGENSSLAAAGLQQLEIAFSRFVNNHQQFPLDYDTVWRGVVSSASYIGDVNADFGNTLYNDHHFHYGYFVHAAAIIAYLDPTWLTQGTNRDWVNTLLRDYANPVDDDPYFPFSRSFDWFHGHSWAKGLFDSADGKDEESSSEDAFAAYAIKMWGRAIGDLNTEARGNLQLAILARSLQNYFLLTDDNVNQPPAFVPNKVSGILFENKVDHTTYFGNNVEFIEGIHMIPINPSSAYTRTEEFVSEEWSHYFDGDALDAIQGGWRGILMANLAIVNPEISYEFFADPDFNWTFLDGGASRTWYLAYAAGLGGG